MAIPNFARNCRNGHRVQRAHRYCPTCGVLILTNAMFGNPPGPTGPTGPAGPTWHTGPSGAGHATTTTAGPWAPPGAPSGANGHPPSGQGVPPGWRFGPDGRLYPPPPPRRWPQGNNGGYASAAQLRPMWAANLLASLPERLRRPAYTALAKVLHPDAGGDEDAMKALNDAWEIVDPRPR